MFSRSSGLPAKYSAIEGEWHDPGFFSSRMGRVGNLWRLIWLLVVPPAGHRIIPTGAGYMLILVSLGMGSVAYNASSNILFMALSLLLSSLLLSGFLSWLNFKGTRWRLHLPHRFRAGESTELQIEIANSKTFLPTYSLWFNARAEQADAVKRIYLDGRLDPGNAKQLAWAYLPQKRGVDHIAISGLESHFPFGFLKKTIGGGVAHEVLVLPERIEYTFKSPGGRLTGHSGEAVVRKSGQAELVNIRPYQRGDSQRLVHWKASARQQTLMVKQMSEENLQGYTLCLETIQSVWSDAEQFEVLCSYVASLAEDLFRQGHLIATVINDGPLTPTVRLADLQRFLEDLSQLAPVEHGNASPVSLSQNVITFKPGSGKHVFAYVDGEQAGTA